VSRQSVPSECHQTTQKIKQSGHGGRINMSCTFRLCHVPALHTRDDHNCTTARCTRWLSAPHVCIKEGSGSGSSPGFVTRRAFFNLPFHPQYKSWRIRPPRTSQRLCFQEKRVALAFLGTLCSAQPQAVISTNRSLYKVQIKGSLSSWQPCTLKEKRGP
jgi:hypothetical protein